MPRPARTTPRLVPLAALALAPLVLALAACASTNAPSASPAPGVTTARTTAARPAASAPAPAPAPAVAVLSVELWTHEGRPGRVITTPSYRIFTTETQGMVFDRLPAFLEHALAAYAAVAPGLPRPARVMDTFMMSTQPQWSRLVQRFLGAEGQAASRIQRGGIAANGRGLFYDIGPRDTFSIAAHEGWHQYTQVAFAEPLPIWLEEGLATTFEGFRWSVAAPSAGAAPGAAPLFLPWANLERFDKLRDAHRAGRLMPLAQLLTLAPQNLLDDPDRTLVYYAQVWALVMFLREGEGGRYAPALQGMIADAAAGRYGARLSASLGARPARAALLRRVGHDPLVAYTGADIGTLDAQYRAFVAQLAATGARDRAVQGVSPVAP